MLLLGTKGSGRKSLLKLMAYIRKSKVKIYNYIMQSEVLFFKPVGN